MKMRTLCDVCESAAAILFCAADEAALCRSCDDKVHMCNKLASRHVRVGLAEPSPVPQCDICENAPAFFYCEIDGSSLCLQCDINVHVGVKRTHGRYLLLRQRVEFPGDKAGVTGGGSQRVHVNEAKKDPAHRLNDNPKNVQYSPERNLGDNCNHDGKNGSNLIDLNARPPRVHMQGQSNQGHAEEQ